MQQRVKTAPNHSDDDSDDDILPLCDDSVVEIFLSIFFLSLELIKILLPWMIPFWWQQ